MNFLSHTRSGTDTGSNFSNDKSTLAQVPSKMWYPDWCPFLFHSHLCSTVITSEGPSLTNSPCISLSHHSPIILLSIYLMVLSFLRQGLTVQPWLAWNSLCSPGWPQVQKSTHFCLPNAGLKICTTKPDNFLLHWSGLRLWVNQF